MTSKPNLAKRLKLNPPPGTARIHTTKQIKENKQLKKHSYLCTHEPINKYVWIYAHALTASATTPTPPPHRDLHRERDYTH